MKNLFRLLLVLSVPAFAETITITDGHLGAKVFSNHDTLLMTGGGGDSITATEFCVLDIRNTTPFSKTTPGGIWTMDLWGYSRLDFSGGEIYDFCTYGNAKAVFSGGQIHQIWSYQDAHILYPESRHIEIVCREYAYIPVTKRITGKWADENETPFIIQLKDVKGYSPAIKNIKFTVIPKPPTQG
jgi:hypothetical protein